MTTTPTYEAVLADRSFDPASVTRPSRTEHKVSHEKWKAEALARVATADLTKPRRTRKRAS